MQGNVRRGLKLTLSQANGTFAEAQTSLQKLLVAGSWLHLVINISTKAEGGCSTKSLTAYLDCCLAWEVGLSLERREERPRRKSGDQLTFRVGSLRPGPGLAVIRAGDVFLLADTSWSQEDVVRDFLLDSRQLLQPAYSPARINMSRLGPSKLSSLTQTCSKLLKEKKASSEEVVLAHLSPGPGQSWSLLSSLLTTCGLEAVLLLPAGAREAGLSDSAVAGAWSAALAVVTASQASLEQFLELLHLLLLLVLPVQLSLQLPRLLPKHPRRKHRLRRSQLLLRHLPLKRLSPKHLLLRHLQSSNPLELVEKGKMLLLRHLKKRHWHLLASLRK